MTYLGYSQNTRLYGRSRSEAEIRRAQHKIVDSLKVAVEDPVYARLILAELGTDPEHVLAELAMDPERAKKMEEILARARQVVAKDEAEARFTKGTFK